MRTPSPADVRGKSQHFDHNLVVDRRPFGARIADQNRVAKRPAVNVDVALSVSLKICSHEGTRRPDEHLLDPPTTLAGPATPIRQADEHLVTALGVPHVRRIDVDLADWTIGR